MMKQGQVFKDVRLFFWRRKRQLNHKTERPSTDSTVEKQEILYRSEIE